MLEILILLFKKQKVCVWWGGWEERGDIFYLIFFLGLDEDLLATQDKSGINGICFKSLIYCLFLPNTVVVRVLRRDGRVCLGLRRQYHV